MQLIENLKSLIWISHTGTSAASQIAGQLPSFLNTYIQLPDSLIQFLSHRDYGCFLPGESAAGDILVEEWKEAMYAHVLEVVSPMMIEELGKTQKIAHEKQSLTFRFRDFCQFCEGFGFGFRKLVSKKSLSFGFRKFCHERKSWFRFRKIWSKKKS